MYLELVITVGSFLSFTVLAFMLTYALTVLMMPLHSNTQAAVGLSTSFATLKGVGMKPFALGIGGALTVGATAYGCASVLPYVMDVTPVPH